VSAEFTDKQMQAFASIVYMHDHLHAYKFNSPGAHATFEWMLCEPTLRQHQLKVWEWMEEGEIVFNHNDAFDKLAEFIIPHGEGSDSVRMQGPDVSMVL